MTRTSTMALAALAVLSLQAGAPATSWCIEKEIDLYGDLDQHLVEPDEDFDDDGLDGLPGTGDQGEGNGQFDYVDSNNNGIQDPGEPSESFDDVNPNGVRDTSTACGPTSAINSFVYLQERYPYVYDSLLVPPQGSDLDGDGDVDRTDDMIAAGTGLAGQMGLVPGTYTGVSLSSFILGKYEWMSDKAPDTTVFGAQYFEQWDPLWGPKPWWVQDATNPTWDWLYDQLVRCEDVEICVGYESGGVGMGHCLTLTSLCWDDVTNTGTIDYIDPLNGQWGESSLELVNGRLESDYGGGAWIAMAMRESPVPEPLTMLGALLGACGLTGYIRKRLKTKV
jgi:hypothetical protein